jgi:hypothetical protein
MPRSACHEGSAIVAAVSPSWSRSARRYQISQTKVLVEVTNGSEVIRVIGVERTSRKPERWQVKGVIACGAKRVRAADKKQCEADLTVDGTEFRQESPAVPRLGIARVLRPGVLSQCAGLRLAGSATSQFRSDVAPVRTYAESERPVRDGRILSVNIGYRPTRYKVFSFEPEAGWTAQRMPRRIAAWLVARLASSEHSAGNTAHFVGAPRR